MVRRMAYVLKTEVLWFNVYKPHEAKGRVLESSQLPIIHKEKGADIY